jgi:hypothetical protein
MENMARPMRRGSDFNKVFIRALFFKVFAKKIKFTLVPEGLFQDFYKENRCE